ncbi:hypothetical protein [Arenicella xantha]|uniref:Hpr(Ser) kinase/phosphatase n=1 Tax=Arenicella xantha TaxID=644221 RepID=A0A395JKQ0_9GAMM|nr:hypothetical protein [Arenicella xantha]RBP48282.1 hypothetical protein DFR28_10811 [Arenicella xantha]
MIRVTSTGFHTADSAAHHYVLAGQPVVFESQVAALSAFYIGPASTRFSELLLHFPEPIRLDQQNAELCYQGQTPIHNRLRGIQYWRKSHRAQIDVDGRPICLIDFDEKHIHLLNEASFDARVNLEVIIGPALVLLLAELDTYCLHAGAVTTPVGNIGIIAESGAGKSTFSRHRDTLWQQISDDILPVQAPEFKDQKPLLLPRFPQLKLPNATVEKSASGKLSLDFLVRLHPEPADTLYFDRLDRRAAMLQIIRHTVATKLFDRDAMQRHARFAKSVCGTVPVLEIRFPRDKKQLASMRMKTIEALAKLRALA